MDIYKWKIKSPHLIFKAKFPSVSSARVSRTADYAVSYIHVIVECSRTYSLNFIQ